MNVYSLVMLDMDGALPQNEASPNTRKLLNRLEKRGVPVILCSSRSPGEVEAAARRTGLESPMVCYGGSLIFNQNQSIIEDIGIDKTTAMQLKGFVEEEFPGVSVSAFIYDTWVVDNANDPYVRRLREIKQRQPIEGPLKAASKSSPHIHQLLCAGELRTLPKLQQIVRERFPALEFTLKWTLSGAACLEAVSSRASQSAAMEKIRSYYQLDIGQIVAVGGCAANLEMLRRAGLGIATGNAPEAVRAAAARVSASCDEEGVYIALKNLRFCPPEA